jgi:hypothetical protein
MQLRQLGAKKVTNTREKMKDRKELQQIPWSIGEIISK